MVESDSTPAEKPVNRACEACRLLKVRCLPDETARSTICQRCKKSGRICIYAAPMKRRQRVRTVMRVAELEKEIQSMRNLLTGNHVGESLPNQGTATGVMASAGIENGVGGDKSIIGGGGSSGEAVGPSWQSARSISHSLTPENFTPSIPQPLAEAAGNESGLLSPGMEDWLFLSFKNDLVQHFPCVDIPAEFTAGDMRKLKPVLFQAMVTAAACQLGPNLFVSLFKATTRLYAERIFINGEKSLELIQALTITSAWYCPPEYDCGPENLHFYQYIHMAATMAIDIGIGTNLDASVTSLEESRTLLWCYLNCAGVAMRMKRPNMLIWSNQMADCLKLAESSPLATPADKCAIAWVKLQNITSEWCSSITADNSHAQTSMKGFQRQLEKWKEEHPADTINISLSFSYHQDNIYVHEAALEGGTTSVVDFNQRAFAPPFRSGGKTTSKIQESLSAAYVTAVMACTNSSHTLLENFLKLDTQFLRITPVIIFVRMSYALVVLVKLCLIASAPSSELGKILDPQTLKIDYYLHGLIEKITEVTGQEMLRIPQKWLTITLHVQVWYKETMISLSQGRKSDPRDPITSMADAATADASGTQSDSYGQTIQAYFPRAYQAPGLGGATPNESSSTEETASDMRRSENSHPPGAGAQNADSASFSTRDTSVPSADYLSMDFTPGDFAFLDDQEMLPADDDFNEWIAATDEMPGSFGPAAEEWSLDLKQFANI